MRLVKRPSANVTTENFLKQMCELLIGTEEICDFLRISPGQLARWRKNWALPVYRLPSGHLAMEKSIFRNWFLAIGKAQLEATDRYRSNNVLPDTEDTAASEN